MYKCECVNPNVCDNNTILYKENIEGIDEWPHVWPDGEVSYRLNNFTRDINAESHQTRAITVALRVWQLRIKKIKFRREYNPDVHVDFNVSFEPADHFSSKNIFAHAWFVGQGDISGDVHFNDGWDWVTHSELQNIGHPPIIPIGVHEFGHSLGLRHDLIFPESIMWPSFNLGKKKNILGPNDIIRITGQGDFIGYGKRSLPQRIIDYFKRRRDLGIDFR